MSDLKVKVKNNEYLITDLLIITDGAHELERYSFMWIDLIGQDDDIFKSFTNCKRLC